MENNFQVNRKMNGIRGRMIKWELKVIPIKNLKPYAKNPRFINKEQMAHLEGLIGEFGMIDKPIVNLDMTIIGGHQRIKVLKKMKEKEVSCWVPDSLLTEEQVEHLCIGLNLNQGQFDYDILANQFDVIDLLKYGFTEEQLVGLSSIESVSDGEKDEKETSKKIKTCPGCGLEF